MGMVTLVVGSPGFMIPFQLDGTVAASNTYSGRGTGMDGSKLEFHGTLEFSVHGIIIHFRYIFMPAGGGQDKGDGMAATSAPM